MFDVCRAALLTDNYFWGCTAHRCAAVVSPTLIFSSLCHYRLFLCVVHLFWRQFRAGRPPRLRITDHLPDSQGNALTYAHNLNHFALCTYHYIIWCNYFVVLVRIFGVLHSAFCVFVCLLSFFLRLLRCFFVVRVHKYVF